MVTEGSPTTGLGCVVSDGFWGFAVPGDGASQYHAPDKFRIWEGFGGGQSTVWLCGIGGCRSSRLNHSANICVKLTKTLVTIVGN